MHGISISRSNHELSEEAATLYFALPDFLLACREHLQLDFPLERIRTPISRLLRGLRSPEARATVATLSGVFASYQATTVQGLEVQSNMSAVAANQIMDLL